MIPILVLLLFGTTFQFMYMVKQKQSNLLFTKVLKLVISLCSGVLFIPILTELSTLLVDSNIALVLVGLLFAPMFAVFGFAYVVCAYPLDPRSLDPMARSHSRIEAAAMGMKTVMSVASTTVSSGTIIAVFALFTSTGVAYLYSWYPPFYNMKTNTTKVIASWVFAWASLSSIVMVTFNDTKEGGPLFMLVGGIPLVALTAKLLLRDRYAYFTL